MDNLSLKYHPSSNTFELSCFDKSKSEQFNKDFKFSLKAHKKSIKDEWVNEIRRILWKQLQYCKGKFDLQSGFMLCQYFSLIFL